MNKYNTKLGQMLSLAGRPQFEKCVSATNADKACKGFTAWQQFVSMSYAQLACPNGLRSLESSLNSNRTCLYHLGLAKGVRRSTISYANNHRASDVFERFFYEMLGTLDRSGRRKFRKDFYAIDATEISLNLHDFPWATFRSTVGGVKIHLKYDINYSIPDYLFITNADRHENDTLTSMRLKRGDTAAFDKGYNNYETFGKFCDGKIEFVTRLKENAKYKVVEERPADSGSIIFDKIIEFTGAQTKKKCPHALRIIKSVDGKTGKSITVLTNILSLTAEYVAKMYRARWNIEIFFKTIKQNLRIKKFYGQSENAVKTQIWIALTVYLLYLKLKELCGNSKKSFTHFTCEIAVCLFERKDLFAWFSGGPPQQSAHSNNDFQLELGL